MNSVFEDFSGEPEHIIYYWAGPLPEICELSILSALNRTRSTVVHLFLDRDKGYKSELPLQVSALTEHPRFLVHNFHLSRWAKRRSHTRLPFSPFIEAKFSDPRTHAGIRRIRHQISALRNLLTVKYGERRESISSFLLRTTPERFSAARKNNWFSRKIVGIRHETFEAWRPASLPFALLTRGKAYRSDVFRTLAVNLFPGESVLYLDLDVYLVSSLSKWNLSAPFVYRWADKDWGNSAVLFFPASRARLRRCLNREIFRGTPALPWFLYSEDNCRRLGISIRSAETFDPMWSRNNVHFDDSDAFFEERPETLTFVSQVQEKFSAVHWHNHWHVKPAALSPFSRFLEHERILFR